MKQTMIQIPFATYVDLLEDSRQYIDDRNGWTIPDDVWQCAIDAIKRYGISPGYADPAYVTTRLWRLFRTGKMELTAEYIRDNLLGIRPL